MVLAGGCCGRGRICAGLGVGLAWWWAVGIEEWSDVAVGEDPFLRVVVDDYLVGVRYFDYCVGAGVAWLEFVGAGKGAHHNLLSNFEW